MRPISNPLKFHDSEGNIRRFLGLELEISSFDAEKEEDLVKVVNDWSGSITYDGSISGGNNAFELRTAPARGVAFVEQMRQICRVLRSANAKANKTCGLHVHIDARDLDPTDLIKIATLWPQVEDKFYAKTFRRRGASGYADKWAASLPGYTPEMPLIQMYNRINDRIRGAPNGRMMGMNFQAMARHGTFENRIHHGTINITKILAWAKMNADFIDFAVASPLKELTARGAALQEVIV